MSKPSEANATTHSGSPRTRSPGIARMPSLMAAAVSRMRRVASRYPSSPVATMAAQHAADSAPGLDPARVGEKYSPPGHSVATKYWYERSWTPWYSTTEVPLAAYPNLCVSADTEVTPGTPKSKPGTS